MEDGVGILGSIVAGSTKGRWGDDLSSACAASTVEYTHNSTMLNPVTSVLVAEEQRLLGWERGCIEAVFIFRPLNRIHRGSIHDCKARQTSNLVYVALYPGPQCGTNIDLS